MRFLEMHIEVSDLKRSLDFYAQLLPHEKVIRSSDGSQMFIVLHDGSAFGIWLESTVGLHGGHGADHLHFAFQIRSDEYDEYKSRLKSLGIEPIEHTWSDGYRSLYFFDPDGHQGEFMTTDWLRSG
jgi:catechol 2,3-dioxygenase-like lactoylglutathione lyase family enzyme